MLFSRRIKPSLRQKTRNLIWPRSGLRRTSRYFAHRVRRMPGTPYAIAAGFACGAAVSMAPFPGLHFVLAGLLAWALRASIIASALGTVVGNPITFPFIWLWIFELGKWMTGVGPAPSGEVTSGELTLSYLWDNHWVWFAMVVGSIPTAIVTWFAFFWPMRRMVAAYQAHRRHRLDAAARLRAGAGGTE